MRLTYIGGKSAKVWEIEAGKNELTVRWGALGRDLQTKTSVFKDQARARAEHDKLVKKKLAEGYREEGSVPRTGSSIAWDKRTRALVHPRRSSGFDAPKVDVAKAWSLLVRSFRPVHDKATRNLRTKSTSATFGTLTTEDKELSKAALAGFRSKRSPSDMSAAVEAVRAHLLDVHKQHWGASYRPKDDGWLGQQHDVHHALVDWWCAARGVPFAVSALIETCRRACNMENLVMRVPDKHGGPGAPTKMKDADATPWDRLRLHVVTSDDATYEEARQVADEMRDKGTVTFRATLAYVFPDEPWAADALRASTLDDTDVAMRMLVPLVSCIGTTKTLMSFVGGGWQGGETTVLDYLYDVLDMLGPAAFEPLQALFTASTKRRVVAWAGNTTPLSAEQRRIVAVISLIESAPVATWFAGLRDDKTVGALAKAYLSRS